MKKTLFYSTNKIAFITEEYEKKTEPISYNITFNYSGLNAKGHILNVQYCH